MAPVIRFAAADERWDQYKDLLEKALHDVGITGAHVSPESLPPETVDYIVYAPNSDVQDFTPYTRLKAVLNLWAGVEDVVGNETLKAPLARMVDPGLTEGMVEWVTGQVLRHHLDIDHALGHQAGEWVRYIPPLARHRPVTVLGMGALGQACAKALVGLNFPVTGWSRTERNVDGVSCYAGDDALLDALRGAQIVVLLLPDTPATENVMNRAAFAALSPGACLINPGRGPLIDDDALLEALESGQVSRATLDVFRQEPLPTGHPFWAHPRVTVTPHIASETRAETAVTVIAENIRRGEAGEPFLHLVDRVAGY